MSEKQEKTEQELKFELYQKQLEKFKKEVKNSMELSNKRSRRNNNNSILKYSIEDISNWMSNPIVHYNNLNNISLYFYNTSAIYRAIVRYMALMPTYAYSLNFLSTPEKVDKGKAKKAFDRTALQLEKMNLKHELIKAMLVCFREDTFYGYEHETKDSYFIQQLDGRYCRISSIEDGVFNFAFDFTYFETYPEDLDLFPKEFKKKYNIYKKAKVSAKTMLDAANGWQWQELDPNKTICLKVNSDFLYPVPPFATMFQSIIDLDIYKKLKKDRTENDNYLAFIQRIPMNDKNQDIDNFLISLDLAMTFHQMAEETLPEGVGVITTPMPVEAIKTESTKANNDIVDDAYRDVYKDAGVNEMLFNADSSSSVGLNKSIMVDEELIFSMLRQVERWTNRKLKNQTGAYKFKVNFLDVTVFNRDEQHAKYLKSAQYGIPVIMEIGATLGLSPLDFVNKVTLESDVLGLHEILKPLNSSFNKLENTEGGRETLSDNEISDSGAVNRDAETDVNRS